MKLISAFIFSLLFICTLSAQRRTYFIHNDFKTITQEHQSVAIVPIKANIQLRPSKRAQITDREFAQMEMDFGMDVQNGIESYFLGRKRKKGYQVKVQDIYKTNKILAAADIHYHNITEFSGEELAEILNVDAVFVGNITATQPTSEEVATAAAIVSRATPVFLNPRTNHCNLSLRLIDQASDILWKFQTSASSGFGSVPNTVVGSLLRKSARKLPYGQR